MFAAQTEMGDVLNSHANLSKVRTNIAAAKFRRDAIVKQLEEIKSELHTAKTESARLYTSGEQAQQVLCATHMKCRMVVEIKARKHSIVESLKVLSRDDSLPQQKRGLRDVQTFANSFVKDANSAPWIPEKKELTRELESDIKELGSVRREITQIDDKIKERKEAIELHKKFPFSKFCVDMITYSKQIANVHRLVRRELRVNEEMKAKLPASEMNDSGSLTQTQLSMKSQSQSQSRQTQREEHERSAASAGDASITFAVPTAPIKMAANQSGNVSQLSTTMVSGNSLLDDEDDERSLEMTDASQQMSITLASDNSLTDADEEVDDANSGGHQMESTTMLSNGHPQRQQQQHQSDLLSTTAASDNFVLDVDEAPLQMDVTPQEHHNHHHFHHHHQSAGVDKSFHDEESNAGGGGGGSNGGGGHKRASLVEIVDGGASSQHKSHSSTPNSSQQQQQPISGSLNVPKSFSQIQPNNDFEKSSLMSMFNMVNESESSIMHSAGAGDGVFFDLFGGGTGAGGMDINAGGANGEGGIRGSGGAGGSQDSTSGMFNFNFGIDNASVEEEPVESSGKGFFDF